MCSFSSNEAISVYKDLLESLESMWTFTVRFLPREQKIDSLSRVLRKCLFKHMRTKKSSENLCESVHSYIWSDRLSDYRFVRYCRMPRWMMSFTAIGDKIGFCKQHRSRWDEPSHLDLRCLTFSLSTLHINFFPSDSLFKKKKKQTTNVV